MKTALDQSGRPWQSRFPVLNTPQLAVSAPVRHSGFFTSIGFVRVDFVSSWLAQWSGSAQSCNSLRVKAASGLVAVLKYLTTPQQGGYSTNQLGGHHG